MALMIIYYYNEGLGFSMARDAHIVTRSTWYLTMTLPSILTLVANRVVEVLLEFSWAWCDNTLGAWCRDFDLDGGWMKRRC